MIPSLWRAGAAAALAFAAAGSAQPAEEPKAAAPAEAPARFPVEAFAELPFLSSARLSPDGSRIAARVASGGREAVGIWRLSDPRDRPPQLIDATHVQSFMWAGDDRLILNVGGTMLVRFGRTTLPVPMRRAMVHDLRTGRTAALAESAGPSDEVIFVDPAGRYALLSMQTRIDRPPGVHRVDLDTGQSVEVQPSRSGIWSWFADSEGVVRAGVDYGERRTKLYYRATPDGELRLIDSRRNQRDDSVVDLIRFASDTSRGYIITNAETGRFALYEYDFAADARGAVLFEHPEVDVTNAVFGAGGELDGVFYEDDRPRVRWMDPELERLQRRIDGAFPGKSNTIVDRSRDGRRVLIFSSAADDPGAYYVYDEAARQLELFASPFNDLYGQTFAAVRPVTYQSRDGLTINGYLTLPPGRPERGLPLVVLPHGGPFMRDSWTFNPEVQFLASRGYAVLQPNFRGSTGYGRDFVERGYGQFGSGMIDDVDDGVDWLAAQGIVDPARVCIMGASYGGYAAIWGAMRSPQRYRCAISLAGMSDLRRMLSYDVRFLIAPRYGNEWRRRVRGEERADLDDISPVRHPERLRIPLLLAHGEQDINVPVEHSRRLVRALERNGIEVESVFYPKSGHGFTDQAEGIDYLRRVEAFLERHNPAG